MFNWEGRKATLRLCFGPLKKCSIFIVFGARQAHWYLHPLPRPLPPATPLSCHRCGPASHVTGRWSHIKGWLVSASSLLSEWVSASSLSDWGSNESLYWNGSIIFK